MLKKLLSSTLIIFLFACSEQNVNSTENSNIKKEEKNTTMPLKDNHSYGNYAEANTTHVAINLTADFENKILKGFVTHTINNNNASKIIFDTKQLNIEKVTTDDGGETTFELGENNEILGQPLTVNITPKTKEVTIYYSTNPKSEAVQWLNPQQTAYKKFPFLFTQGEAILTRSWIPIQDSPGNKITYSAQIQVPEELTAVMSAKNIPNEETIPGHFEFEMNNPIPCYLIALAIGKLEYESLGKRSGVYAEPNMIEACAYEFGDLEKMISAAEELYGPYDWDRYDIIVLPPSFPFGGMENPMLTFATPTIIAGDRSLTSLVAHELAHSWSGNLVTNATWDDFWLNEGFTVYFENRIMEQLYGKDYADMLRLLGYEDLLEEMKDLSEDDTHLKLHLEGRNPDDGMTYVAYEKGALFLTALEQYVGRDKFDNFLRNYFSDFSKKCLTTEDFVNYLNEKLPETKNFDIDSWIYKAGIPENAPKITSQKLKDVEDWHVTERPKSNLFLTEAPKAMKNWSTHEWLHYIKCIDTNWNAEAFKKLDAKFKLTESNNSEIAAAWFEKSLDYKYDVVLENLEAFLIKVGRRKFLVPLYKALIRNGKLDIAKNIYEKARPNYHFVSTNTLDELIK